MSKLCESAADSSNLHWYLVYTKPRKEHLALAQLTLQGYECYLPLLRVKKIRRKKIELIDEALFARYLFIRLDNSGSGLSWTPIQYTQGVTRLVRFGNDPAIIEDALIERLRSRESTQAVTNPFNPGDVVLVTEGPFAGLEAIYNATDGAQRAIILIQMLNRPMNIKIDLVQLSKQT